MRGKFWCRVRLLTLSFNDASMPLSRLCFLLALVLAPVALVGTTWLYLYPIFHGCAFPKLPSSDSQTQSVAPFRLLALGDPQLEGDSSLPDPNAPILPSLEYLVPHLQNAESNAARLDMVKEAAKGATKDAKKWLEGKRKAIDLWGNDWYLAHIVRSLHWWTQPSHVAVLGDLLGSQWITDGEFEKRAGRYWNTVMKGLDKVPDRVFDKAAVQDETNHDTTDTITTGEASPVENATEEETRTGILSIEEKRGKETNETGQNDEEKDKDERESAIPDQEQSVPVSDSVEADVRKDDDDDDDGNKEDSSTEDDLQKPVRKPSWGGTTEVLGADQAWGRRVINIAGNHDVGYAGDLDEPRILRFEKAFGSVNWDIWFTLPEKQENHDPSDGAFPHTIEGDKPPALRLVILNSMNMDTPAWSSDLQTETYSFMNHIIKTSRPVEDKTHATILLTHIPLEKQPGICVDSPYFNFYDEGHGVREQNMLSDFSSKTVLESIFGMSSNMFAAGEGLGRRGIVLNGHDHEGCDVVHFIRQDGVFDACDPENTEHNQAYWPISVPAKEKESSEPTSAKTTAKETSPANPFMRRDDDDVSPAISQHPIEETLDPEQDPAIGWRAHRFPYRPYDITRHHASDTTSCTSINRSPHIREVTLRSMMGEFSGYAGFLSAWFDPTLGTKGEWVFEMNTCGLGVQHWWWGIHIIDLVLLLALILGYLLSTSESLRRKRGQRLGYQAKKQNTFGTNHNHQGRGIDGTLNDVNKGSTSI